MNDWHIQPLDKLLTHRFKRIIEKVAILLKLLKSEHKFDSLKEWDTVCRGMIDSLFADIYWTAEHLKIKNKSSINNPFFIWCRMFDTLKHFDRTSQVADNICNKTNIETSLLGTPIIRDVSGFLLNWKCMNDKISDEDFKQLMIKFILPMEIDINPDMRFFEKTREISILFWDSIKSFFAWLAENSNNIDINNLFDTFLNSRFNNNKIEQCWNKLKEILSQLYKL